MEKDTDVDMTVHLSFWPKLKAIQFLKHGLIVIRTYEGFPNKIYGNMLSVKTKESDIYLDIYCNPAFPKLQEICLNGETYTIPQNPELYLEMLYGKNWRIPSSNHASTRFHRNSGLVKSQYKDYWDPNFKIFQCKF